jgi:predicted kinase
MAEKRESNKDEMTFDRVKAGQLIVKVDVDCSEALKGLKALTRAAKKATASLKELDEQQNKIAQTFNIEINLDGKEVHHKTFLTPENINDPDITLGWDNLQLLCRPCHNAVHEKAYELFRAKNRRNPHTSNGLTFDDEGNLVEKKNVFIVWGPPASGKTTYVKENKGKYDIVIDLDYIMAALSLCTGKDRTEDALPFALDIRDLLYDLIAQRKHYFENAWIVAGLPEKGKRLELKTKLKAELIYMDVSKEECLLRAKADEQRLDKTTQYKIIENYFSKLE